MLANLDDVQEQQQVQATPQNREPDPGDQEFDEFQGEGNEKVEGFYGPLVAGDENAEAGSGDGQPAATAQTQQQVTPQDQQTPIRVVRYQGREIPIYTKEEEEGLLSKGMDYTQKTMALAPWRKRVEFLYQNPDKLQLIDRLMAGEELTPEAIAAASKETGKAAPAKADDKPEQKDDETFEDYTERLSEWKARQIVKAEMETFRAESARREFQAAALQDPLMPYITKAIEADVQSGFLPEEAFKAADADPTAAAKLYGAYRKRIVSMIETAKANGGGNPQQPIGQARQPQQPFMSVQPAQTQQRTTQQPRRPAPFAESGNGSRRPAAKGLGNVEAQVIRDMSLTDFEAYVDRVKSGG